jgi:ABC-type glycerol-3-phosphate transport system substrate-binding protein
MKKLVSLALVLVMVMLMAPAAFAADPITINFWHTGGSGALQEAIKFAVDKFNTTVGAEKGITVVDTFIGNYDELTAKIQLSIQAKEQPQVAILANTMVGWFMEDDVLADMAPYAQKDGFDVSNIMSPFMLTMGNQNGELHSVPFFRSTPMLYYNKGMADAAGLTPPTTIAELEEFAKKLYKVNAAGETEVWGFECLKDFGYYNAANLWQLGSSMFNEDGSASPALGDGTMLKVLSDWRRWIDEGWCRPFDSTDQGPKMLELFYQGKLASFWNSCGSLRNVMKGCADAGIEVGVMPFTTYDAAKPVSEIGGGNVGIIAANNSEEQIAASWEFVKMLMSDEVVANTSMTTGYVPVTNSVATYPALVDYWAKNPLAKVPYDQLSTAKPQEFPYVPFLQDFTIVCWDASSLLIQDKSINAEEAVEFIKTNTANLF